MGSNPYEATRRRTSNERASDLAHLLTRLRALGADEDQVADVARHWDDFGDGYTPEDRAALVRSSDAELRAKILDVEEEYRVGTMTEEQDERDRHFHRVVRAEVEAFDLMTLPVAKLLAWVGDDRARAIAVQNLEAGPDGGSRKSLLAGLEKVISGT